MRTANLGLWALSVGLVLLPLTAFKPGLPATFKADEPAYYLAAESLVRDFDLRVDSWDLERIFQSFPYFPAENVIISSDDGWNSIYFGKPYLYSLMAAPMVGIWGADGMVAFNMLLLVGMIWMGALWLRRFNPSWLADLFAVGFFVLGIPYAYVFWLHPEVFNMFAAAACLFFGLGMGGGKLPPRWALSISAACLAAGVYNKPMLAALGLPVCIELLRSKRWRHLALWLAASALSISIYAAGSWALVGNPTAYLVDFRAGYLVLDPQERLVEPKEKEPESIEAESAIEKEEKRAAGWWWILSKPHVKGFELAEDIPHFFFGRHTGLFVYQPFVLLAWILFLLHGRRRLQGWSILCSALMVGAFFMITIPFNWHGGGGFIGNRYFVMACPAFIFMVTRIRPDWSVIPTTALATVLVGPLVLAPYGLVVPKPTLQSLARNPAFDVLPFELAMGKIPGHHGMVQKDTWIWGRKDHIQPSPDGALFVSAGNTVDLWLHRNSPAQKIELELTSEVEQNSVTISLGELHQTLPIGREPTRFVFEPEAPTFLRKDRKASSYFEFTKIWIYHLRLEIERGEMPEWGDGEASRFYTGASVRLTEVVSAPKDEPDSEIHASHLSQSSSTEVLERRADGSGVSK